MKIEYKDKAWLILRCLHDFGPQTRQALANYGDDAEASDCLNLLSHARLIRRTAEGDMEITLRGENALAKVSKVEDEPSVAGSRSFANATTKTDYDGKELGPTCHRAGAYDAYQLPSLINGERVFRKGVAA